MCMCGAVGPEVPEEGTPDGAWGGREITFHGLNYSWRGQRNQVEKFHGARGQV